MEMDFIITLSFKFIEVQIRKDKNSSLVSYGQMFLFVSQCLKVNTDTNYNLSIS